MLCPLYQLLNPSWKQANNPLTMEKGEGNQGEPDKTHLKFQTQNPEFRDQHKDIVGRLKTE